MIADGEGDGNGFCDNLACLVTLFRAEKPGGDLWIVDEFELKKHDDGLAEVGALPGEADGADSVLEMSPTVLDFEGSPPGGLKGRDFFYSEIQLAMIGLTLGSLCEPARMLFPAMSRTWRLGLILSSGESCVTLPSHNAVGKSLGL